MELRQNYAPHQQRVVDEAKELFLKLDALSGFIIDSPIFEKLDSEEQSRLRRQLIVMIDYHNILEERINAF